jgi:uncharacterized protein
MSRAVLIPSQPSGDPEDGQPAADRILSGSPRTRTWNLYESADGKTFCGIWECTPGKWRIHYDEWESCTLLSGRSVVTQDGGDGTVLEAGDSLVLEPGFSGTWEVVETTRKSYVIRL